MDLVKEVYENIYLVEIPLPNNPLKALNSYVVKGEGKNLIIDTGFNRKECRQALMAGLEKLNLDLANTYLLITHLHADHAGLGAELNQEGVQIYTSAIDGEMINQMTKTAYWEKLDKEKLLMGLEEDNLNFNEHPGYKYCPKKEIIFTPLKEGDRLKIGSYNFKVIDIPGHTPGHIGLYEDNHSLFFAGDHVLDSITPNIDFWGFDTNILEIYFNSLKKIYNYNIDYLFPAHRNIIRDHKRRIDELISHHKERLLEIEEIIKDKSMTVRDVASKMEWRIRADSWKDFPNPQKWFATGEAMSHLEYLVYTNRVEKIKKDGVLYYRKL